MDWERVAYCRKCERTFPRNSDAGFFRKCKYCESFQTNHHSLRFTIRR